jgi:hypothetical protein
MIAIAGCCGTPNLANTSPASSLICGKVNPCLSTKPWNETSSPYQATPRNCTLPAQRWLAASTEGASWLQVTQVGAQNHSITGLPA